MGLELAQRKWRFVGRLVALSMLAIGSIAGMAVGSSAQAETKYTPSVHFAQKYDSNVYFTAKQRIPQGTQSWDFISTLGGKIELLNKSRLGDTLVRAGVDGSVFAYNTNLSYASTNVFASSDLTDWAQELLPGLKLRISDSFRYTPQQPTFTFAALTPQPGGGQPSAPFSSGFQGARADSYSNTVSTEAGYSFSRSVGLRANYSYSILHIGRVYVPSTAATATAFNYWDTQVHNVGIGPTFMLDGGDTLLLRFGYLSSEQTNTAGTSPSREFTAQSIQPEYVTRIVREWTAKISAGATVVEQVGNKTFFSGSVTLTNDFDRQTRVSLEGSRQATPAFIGIGGAFISNIAQLYVSHDFSRVVSLTVRGGFAYNESTPVKTFTSEIINGSAALNYNLTGSTKLSLSQEYSHYSLTGVPDFDKLVTMLSVNTEWQ